MQREWFAEHVSCNPARTDEEGALLSPLRPSHHAGAQRPRLQAQGCRARPRQTPAGILAPFSARMLQHVLTCRMHCAPACTCLLGRPAAAPAVLLPVRPLQLLHAVEGQMWQCPAAVAAAVVAGAAWQCPSGCAALWWGPPSAFRNSAASLSVLKPLKRALLKPRTCALRGGVLRQGTCRLLVQQHLHRPLHLRLAVVPGAVDAWPMSHAHSVKLFGLRFAHQSCAAGGPQAQQASMHMLQCITLSVLEAA